MIETINLKKSFGDNKAVNGVSLTIQDGCIFGLIGTNGAGKSTYMRLLSGVLKADEGQIKVDDQEVYDNEAVKGEICFLSDDQYFPAGASPESMEKYYSMVYSKFDSSRFYKMLEQFGLKKNDKIRTYSKGMKKQLQMLLGICANTRYLLCDETFDGLDPVMRQAIKSIIAGEMAERDFTPVIASHNLRELEDICDSVGLLYQGGVVLNKGLDELKSDLHRIQCVFKAEEDYEAVTKNLDIIKDDRRGSMHLMTVRGNAETIETTINNTNPVFSEVLPLTLEEIFISEAEVVGYDVKKLIL